MTFVISEPANTRYISPIKSNLGSEHHARQPIQPGRFAYGRIENVEADHLRVCLTDACGVSHDSPFSHTWGLRQMDPIEQAATAATTTPAVEQTDAFVAPPHTGSAGRIPGSRAIWVGITSVFVEFTVLFTVYFVARSHFPEAFRAGAELLPRLSGTLITLAMISSSFCLAASVATIRAGANRASLRWLVLGVLLALTYPVIKYFEITWNLAHGIDAHAGVFVGAYYYLTLNHLVHATWGILGMFWVLARHYTGAYSADEYGGLEALASYWHATDIIWLAIFPFFYVLA